MKNTKSIQINYLEYPTTELSEQDAKLYNMAKDAANNAYAPYSKFNVGCALLLKNGTIIKGNNQENAAFPSGLCAERVAFFYAGANYPLELIDTIVIAVISDKKRNDHVYAPCAACRQSMLEFENRQNAPIRILFEGENNSIIEIEDLASLIPFSFTLDA